MRQEHDLIVRDGLRDLAYLAAQPKARDVIF
jgi:hypothetical protein